ncbi:MULTISPECIES: HipA domain-containing protein [unclassified Arcicella]|uniref:HipA domain-containing protein n=1 Tax=unclassified Arcicella TaxID=2644986 RepID=UPI002862890B|nr:MULTISPECIES: HipA domain-containing protein [unclassified Arcicella]MDR6564662.1 serine/threonine-protein kinase HipA [Arcicella sp. BE51]MDR6814410.1 serine/threonine-protein kinase HipA [Arcicella sp. BE140]MDR6825834.1 serine/threonine-protein kinase HipA [Arcicella sp. BE139]
MNKCLYCYQDLADSERDFHPKCAKKLFGVSAVPEIAFGKEELQEMARKLIITSIAITGVQPKLSLDLEKIDTRHRRFTIVGLQGDYILKPFSDDYPQLPENEDLTMNLAALCDIKTAEHTLIRLISGELAYLAKRFDRKKGKKIHVEDLCQLTETLTEHKYRASMEKVGKTIKKFSTNAGLDVISFFEISVFCFLTGNADMHLKNFSLMSNEMGEIQLSPAYDLLSTKLAMPQDAEEMALTINGKRNRLKKTDFDILASTLGINEKAKDNIYKKFSLKIPLMLAKISESFLDEKSKQLYKDLINNRAIVLG